jgi:hypothetical protein
MGDFPFMTATPITQGDSPTFRFSITNPAPDALTPGDPFNLNNYTASFFIKRSLQDSDAAAEFQGTLTSGISVPFQPEDGILDVTVPASVTKGLRLGKLYWWYLVLTNSITNNVYTPARGTFLAMLPDQV